MNIEIMEEDGFEVNKAIMKAEALYEINSNSVFKCTGCTLENERKFYKMCIKNRLLWLHT